MAVVVVGVNSSHQWATSEEVVVGDEEAAAAEKGGRIDPVMGSCAEGI